MARLIGQELIDKLEVKNHYYKYFDMIDIGAERTVQQHVRDTHGDRGLKRTGKDNDECHQWRVGQFRKKGRIPQ